MLRNALILLATGGDRPGIVERVSGLAFDCGANLEDSRMAILGGEFALIALVTGGAENLERVREGASRLAEELQLTVQCKETAAGPEARSDVRPYLPYEIYGVAMDHPGIVHRVTRVLADQGVNVARLDTSVVNAPVTGAPIFSLRIEVEVPDKVSVPKLRARLSEVADRENIDLELRPAE